MRETERRKVGRREIVRRRGRMRETERRKLGRREIVRRRGSKTKR